MNLLITGAWRQANEYIDIIEKKGHKVRFLQFEKGVLPCDYEWVEGIVGNGIFLTHPIEKFTNLKYIQLTSAGVDRVSIDYVKEHNINIYNARGVYSVPMAEYAVAGVLSLYKEQRFFVQKQNEHIWEKRRDLNELCGKKVCILGCGSVGEECAKRFAAFDCMVLGIDTKVRKHKDFFRVYGIDAIKELLTKSDIVIITLPLTDETYHMFDKEMFDSMKHGAIIVNIARGALVETAALVEALQTKLFGAVLDVFEEEPLGKSPLWDMKNVIITPHNSFVGSGNGKRMCNLIMRNLENYKDENIGCIT